MDTYNMNLILFQQPSNSKDVGEQNVKDFHSNTSLADGSSGWISPAKSKALDQRNSPYFGNKNSNSQNITSPEENAEVSGALPSKLYRRESAECSDGEKQKALCESKNSNETYSPKLCVRNIMATDDDEFPDDLGVPRFNNVKKDVIKEPGNPQKYQMTPLGNEMDDDDDDLFADLDDTPVLSNKSSVSSYNKQESQIVGEDETGDEKSLQLTALPTFTFMTSPPKETSVKKKGVAFSDSDTEEEKPVMKEPLSDSEELIKRKSTVKRRGVAFSDSESDSEEKPVRSSSDDVSKYERILQENKKKLETSGWIDSRKVKKKMRQNSLFRK